MTREEEFYEQAKKFADEHACDETWIDMAFGFRMGAIYADNNPRKFYVVVRCEEHDDYIEKVFADKTKANEYCNKFEGNPNEYGRYYTEMEVTL